MWVATYYVATRFGSMCEKRRTFGGHLPQRDVHTIMDKWVERQRYAGVPIHTQFDLNREGAAPQQKDAA